MAMELALSALAFALALALRPWRQLAAGSHLVWPVFVCALCLPVVWALPFFQSATTIAPHWSAAPLVGLGVTFMSLSHQCRPADREYRLCDGCDLPGQLVGSFLGVAVQALVAHAAPEQQ